MSQFPNSLKPSEEDVAKLLATSAHLGGRNCTKHMETYVWKRRSDGVHIFDLNKTWAKLSIAARILAGIENPKDVCALSVKSWGQRAVLKFAQYTGARAIAGRFTPGTFTNQITSGFLEPRVLVVTDPKMDHQPLKEASYVNIPSIAFCNTDSPMEYVDIAIPCNNKGKHAIGLMWWFLAREVLRYRDPRNYPRSAKAGDFVMVDLFIFRDPEEEQAQLEAAEFSQDFAQGDVSDWGAASAGADASGNWEEGNWSSSAPADDWAADSGAQGAGAGWQAQGLSVPVSGWDAPAEGGN